MIIFVLPHQFVGRLAQPIASVAKPGFTCISLIKGIEFEGGPHHSHRVCSVALRHNAVLSAAQR